MKKTTFQAKIYINGSKIHLWPQTKFFQKIYFTQKNFVNIAIDYIWEHLAEMMQLAANESLQLIR